MPPQTLSDDEFVEGTFACCDGCDKFFPIEQLIFCDEKNKKPYEWDRYCYDCI